MKEDFLIESNHQIENAEEMVNDTEDNIETTISDQHASGEGLEIDVQESSYSSTVSEEETLENVNSEVSLSTYEIIDENTEICGVSLKGRQHTEDNAEGNTVEGCSDGIVISQNKQAKDTNIHQEGGIAVGGREISDQIGILQQPPVILGFTA